MRSLLTAPPFPSVLLNSEMADNQTIPTKVSVDRFLDKVDDESKRDSCYELAALMSQQTGFKPVMWGPAIVGFGSYHYKYDSGREGDAPFVAFSPRKAAIVLYFSMEPDKRTAFLKKFGKHKLSGGCIYVKKMEDIDEAILNKMIAESVKYLKKKYPEQK